jgi:hypothetical protein
MGSPVLKDGLLSRISNDGLPLVEKGGRCSVVDLLHYLYVGMY